ncbi:basement membrane-specific heparan sulfate proteoglycan core protein-like [Sardina pilchardus]|uniref:basement membrane-specific heparan sulfate proteoglycan core protein-like n=1 Tax=Sardina pilchardus TaxID=27697 RepID=UPI002E112AAE
MQLSFTSSDLPVATVAVVSPQPPYYAGDKVTLRCDIAEHTYYYWYKDNLFKENKKTLTIPLPDHAGQYTCEGYRSDRKLYSQRSAPVSISVTDLPTAKVTAEPQSPVFTGETVTLKCVIESLSGWTYKWYKASSTTPVSEGNTFTIRGAAESHKGQYWCQGERRDRPTSSQPSRRITIDVKALPTATVTESPEGPYYPGDKVTLRCDIAEHTDWNWYYWYRDGNSITNWGRQAITISLPDQAGQYTCEGSRRNRPKTSQRSTAASISARSFPVPTLTVQRSPVFTGETVTLTCGIQPSTGWSYRWNRHQSSKVNTYTISEATLSHQGEYKCYGVRDRSWKSSHYSNTVQLTVKAPPLATLTVEPQGPVFTGEMVTLKCVIESLSGWTYKWYKESSTTPVSVENTFTITAAAESHKGQYWCQGERRDRPTSSQPSRRITIDVKASKPKLTLSPDHQLLTGDSVTLRCELGVSSGLVFYWYRDKQISDPVNQTDGDSYSISSVKVSDGGRYWCRAGRGDPVFYTQYSDAAEIKVTDAGSSKLVVAVGVVIGLLFVFALVILMVLMYRSQKAKGSVSVTANLVQQQSDSHSPTSQNRVLELCAVAGASDVLYAEIELKDTDKEDKKKKEAKRSATLPHTLYSILRPVKSPVVSDGGGDGSSDVTYANVKSKKRKKQDSAGPSDVTYADVQIKMKPLGSRAKPTNQPEEHLYSAVKPGCSSNKE